MTDRPLKLAVFDVDGTLVDSQAHILAAMDAAYGDLRLPLPERAAMLRQVGLSLHELFARLEPDLPADTRLALAAAYKDAYARLRSDGSGKAHSPLFDGMGALLDRLARVEPLLLGVATGKSRRGLDHVLELHGLERTFLSRQVADDHPSKPHPAMLHAALSETGCEAPHAVMIGDTVFDMEMGHAAGMKTIAVSWGYHPRAMLEDAAPDILVDRVGDLGDVILELLDLSDD
ncbi:MAG: HAD-IA family hydrolase [Rhodobacteraceae bacterium]|nr:HAD-IA family hydrolase [Paracoccaceae bacterium]